MIISCRKTHFSSKLTKMNKLETNLLILKANLTLYRLIMIDTNRKLF